MCSFKQVAPDVPNGERDSEGHENVNILDQIRTSCGNLVVRYKIHVPVLKNVTAVSNVLSRILVSKLCQ